MRLENGWLIYAKPDGVIEITQGRGNLKPGEKGQYVGSAIWFRINNGEWIRSKTRMMHYARAWAQEVTTCEEFVEKAREDSQ